MKANAWLASVAAIAIVAISDTPAFADLPILKRSCSINNSYTSCPQLDPKLGTLVSIDVSYYAIDRFALSVTGNDYTTTDYKVTVWQELDTMGGDIGSTYLIGTGTIGVTPGSAPSPQPTEIVISGGYAGTTTDPVALARFVGTKSVPILPIAEPATGAGKLPVVGTGTIQSFYLLNSNVTGTLTLNYYPVLRRPPFKLPPQKLPKPPFTVPPYPKPKT